MKDIILGGALLVLGIFILILGLAGTSLFPKTLEIILAVLILGGGIGYSLYRYKHPPLTEEHQLVTSPISTIQQQLSEHKNVYQLNQYVSTLLQRGKKEQEIKNLCKTAGWSEKEVSDALDRARKTTKADPYKQIEDYITLQLAKGTSPENIQVTLQKAGWKKEVIDTLIKKNSQKKK